MNHLHLNVCTVVGPLCDLFVMENFDKFFSKRIRGITAAYAGTGDVSAPSGGRWNDDCLLTLLGPDRLRRLHGCIGEAARPEAATYSLPQSKSVSEWAAEVRVGSRCLADRLRKHYPLGTAGGQTDMATG